MTDADAELAAQRGAYVVTTLSGPDGLPDTALLARFIKEKRVRSVAIPPLGSGNGGLDWTEVTAIRVLTVEDYHD